MARIAKRQKTSPVVHRLGKARAREQFAPLVEMLAAEGGIVEITDYGKTAAVMLGYHDYMLLLAQSQLTLSHCRPLRGSGELVGDLEETTGEITKVILESIKKTVNEL